MSKITTQKKTLFLQRKDTLLSEHNAFISRSNIKVTNGYNGIFHRYQYPVLTARHIPLFWRYDFNEETNPFLMERLEVNTVFNAGAIEWNGRR